MTEDQSTLIARLEDERYDAMVAGDLDRLDALLDDRLRYVHSSGAADSKDSYLDGFRKGLWAYRSVSREDQTIVVLENAALVYNRLHIDVVVSGAPKTVDSRALAVWNLADGRWRLVALFSASVPPA